MNTLFHLCIASYRLFPASKQTILEQCFDSISPYCITSHVGKQVSYLKHSLCFSQRQQIKWWMLIWLEDCEVCRKFVRLSSIHTHFEHPVYLASSPIIGCGVSAHYWQLGVIPMEHACPMTVIQSTTEACACTLFYPYKTVHSCSKWIGYCGNTTKEPPVTFRGHLRQ